MKVRRITLLVLVFLCLGTIFLFSSQQGEESESLSDQVTTKIITFVSQMTHKEVNEKETRNLVREVRTFMRKTAHFTIYLLLGLFMYGVLRTYHIKYPLLYSLVFCFLYACTDEIHQLFIEDRTGRIFDIFVDTSGSFLGSIISHSIYKLFRKIKEIGG